MTDAVRGRTICHVFSGDLWAGAEVVNYNLLTALHSDAGVRVIAVSLNEGVLTDRLRRAGVPTYVVPETQYSLFSVVRKAARLLKTHDDSVCPTSSPPTRTRGQRLRERWRTAVDHAVVKRDFVVPLPSPKTRSGASSSATGFRASQIRVIRNGGRLPATLPPTAGTRDGVHVGTVARMVPVKDSN